MVDSTPGTLAHASIEVRWTGGLAFEAGRAQGATLRIDGEGREAPSPFDALLAAIASCAAVDVLTILEKQRTPVQALQIAVEARRVDATPRRLAAALLHFRIRAPGTTLEKATRAVELSVSKYCSVRSSLAGDIPVTWQVELAGELGGQPPVASRSA